MDPVDDRHVGQKNEQVLTLASGESFTAKIKAMNVIGIPAALTLEVQPVRSTAVHPLLKSRTLHLSSHLQAPSSVLPLSLRFSNAPAVYTKPSTLFASRLLSLAKQEVAGKAADTISHTEVTHTAQFEPWESRMVEVSGRVPSNAKVGQSYAFRVVQRIGRMITGGYTVNVVVVKQ
jgi:hypothetical protein